MKDQASNGFASGTTRALLVTRAPEATGTAWADVATSADEALALQRQGRHGRVFADFGPLPCGMTGTQLARRVRAEDPSALVFLLSSQVSPVQAMWARSNGAFAVVPRNRHAIAACLSGWTLGASGAPLVDGPPLDDTMQEARQLVISSLLSLGRLGPETLSAVEMALLMLARARNRASMGVAAMAGAIAHRIVPREQRAVLLDWLGRAVPANARAGETFSLAGSTSA
jgi:hypothetical protein